MVVRGRFLVFVGSVFLFNILPLNLVTLAWRNKWDQDFAVWAISLSILTSVVLLVLLCRYAMDFLQGTYLELKAEKNRYQQQAVKYMKQSLEGQKVIAYYKQQSMSALQDVDRANEQRDKDIANISHELRTPLTGLVNGSEMLDQAVAQSIIALMGLRDKMRTPENIELINSTREVIRQIYTIQDHILKPSINSMEGVVTQLLDSLEDITLDGEIKLVEQAFSLKSELIGVLEPYKEKANSKNLVFSYIGLNLNDPDPYLMGDAFRVGQVVSCLVDNAIRFTSDGGVSIELDVQGVKRSSRKKITLSVCDTGCGISQEQKNKVFELFHIGENELTKENSGLGTGLTIARKVAEAMGGQLKLRNSDLGQGSCFTFWIELDAVAKTRYIMPAVETEVTGLCLLYVEDAKVNRAIFKRNCEGANVNLQLAEDGLDGWEKYESYQFDALVVDLYMPRCDGFELVKKIRAYEKKHQLPRIPIFALTAAPTEKNKRLAIESGFDEFLAKPYKRPVFNYIVDRSKALSKKKAAYQPASANCFATSG